ncbi:MAG: hypothetical protein CME32_25685, partial [Gimesia sp.]|nr:hypothetical protein [Gimesia sp.]
GHPSPLIYQAQNKTWIPFGSEQGASEVERNFPLGITVEQNYSNQSCKLGREDLMLCFTDGLLEFKQADGSLLGEAGLLRLLSQLDCSQPERLISELLQRLDPDQERINAADDISLMLFQRNNERVSLYDNLAAPFRALKHFFSRKEKA